MHVPAISSVAPASPRLPEPLAPLLRLARNMAWCWVPGVGEVFDRLDGVTRYGPVAALWTSTNLDELAADAAYLRRIRDAEGALDLYLAQPGKHAGFPGLVAYFCAEYGLHESLPIYSGGLGILAGDHCKEASDQSLPFVAVGLFYRRGFFRQMIDHEGRQEHEQPLLVPSQTPVERVVREGVPLTVSVELPGRKVQVAVWRVLVGKVSLLLLDTDLPENAPYDRPITSQLYTSGRDMRLHQEIVLGIGGVRVLEALGISPTVWHLNEGHSAFLLLERLRRGESAEEVRDSSILTIHTPVPAGNERFDAQHTIRTLSAVLEGSSLVSDEVLKLGRDSVDDPKVFDMTAFALRLTREANGVSRLHGKTAHKTWRKVARRPIVAVTNGVHMPTWLGPEMRELLGGAGASLEASEVVPRIPVKELLHAHTAQKDRMIEFVRRRLAEQHARHGAGPGELAELLNALVPEALIIGFARRFATYKRADLLFSDERRLARLLGDKKRPVQIISAGKAHPADLDGQKLIARVYAKTQSSKWRGKLFLLEDYDMEAGRLLVQGVDLWLNNPRRPLEASGTSGMKAAANGVPNCSILDGWWDEAYVSKNVNGFAIGRRTPFTNEKLQDRSDAEALYRVLEEEVLPRFFDRREEWVRMMRASIASSVWAFSTARMIDDYVGIYR